MTADSRDTLHRAGIRLGLAGLTAAPASRAGLLAAAVVLLADDPEAALERLADGDVSPDPTVVATLLAIASRDAR